MHKVVSTETEDDSFVSIFDDVVYQRRRKMDSRLNNGIEEKRVNNSS